MEKDALQQKKRELHEQISILIQKLHPSPGFFVSSWRWVTAIGMASGAMELAAFFIPLSLVLRCSAAVVVGVGGALLGWWIGDHARKKWQAHTKSRITRTLRKKKEALFDLQLTLLQRDDLEESEQQFVIHPFFEGEEVIYGDLCLDIFLAKLQTLVGVLERKRVGKIRLKTMDFSRIDVIEDLEALLITALEVFDPEYLILRKNHLKRHGLKCLRKAVLRDKSMLPSLKRLDLSENELTGDSLPTIRAIGGEFDLEEINLSGNICLGGTFVREISSGRRSFIHGSTYPLQEFLNLVPEEMPSLKALTLRNIGLGSSFEYALEENELIEALATLLGKAPLLEHLDLRENPELKTSAFLIVKRGIAASIALRKIEYDEEVIDEQLTHEVKTFLTFRRAVFETLTKEQPVLVSLLNAKRRNELSPEFVGTLVQDLSGSRLSLSKLYFDYFEIENLLDKLLTKRKESGRDLQEEITEQELIAYMKVSFALPEDDLSDVELDERVDGRSVTPPPDDPQQQRPIGYSSRRRG